MDDIYLDPLYEEAVKVIIESKSASASLLQKKLHVGFARASRIIDSLEEIGYISSLDNKDHREVLVTEESRSSIDKAFEEAKQAAIKSKIKERQEREEWYKEESLKYQDHDPVVFFPWADVYNNTADFKTDISNKDIACPNCGKSIKDLKVIYFRSPDWTWKEMCGREGWLVICEDCKKQVYFKTVVMN